MMTADMGMKIKYDSDERSLKTQFTHSKLHFIDVTEIKPADI